MSVNKKSTKPRRGRPPGPTARTLQLAEKVHGWREKGWPVTKIAKKYGCTRGYIYYLLSNFEVVEE